MPAVAITEARRALPHVVDHESRIARTLWGRGDAQEQAVVNFVKVGTTEDASAVLEEICRWWPGDRHNLGRETSSSLSYLRGGEGPNESGKGIGSTRAGCVIARTFIPWARNRFGIGKRGGASRKTPGTTVPRRGSRHGQHKKDHLMQLLRRQII